MINTQTTILGHWILFGYWKLVIGDYLQFEIW